MSFQAGRAFITVVPSFKGWHEKTAAFLKSELRAIKIPVEYDLPKLPPIVPGKPVKIKAEIDEGSFERNVKAKLRASLAALPKDIGLRADATDAEREIASLRTQLESLSKQRIGVDVSADAALAEITYVRRELERLGAESPNVQVRADAAAAVAELEAVQGAAEKLARSRPTVTAKADTAEATTKLTALGGLADRLDGKTIRIRTSISAVGALSALPALGVGAGALGGVAALGGAAIAGVATAAAIGTASISKALGLQKQLTQASKARVSAIAGVRSAESGLASASASASSAQISAARGIQSAEQSLADARRAAARTAEQSARSIAAAQQQVVNAQDQVRASLKALHEAQEQRKRDLVDLANQGKDNSLSVEGDQIALIEAQQRLATAQKGNAPGSLAIRKADLDVAQAQQALVEAQLKAQQDAADLTKAQKNPGSLGVSGAQDAVTAALKGQKDAVRELGQAKKDAGQAQADAARSVQRAEQGLSQARADGARSVAQAQAQVAAAQQRLAAAQAKLAAADSKRLTILGQMGPMQDKIIAGVKALGLAWDKLIFSKPVTSAALSGISAAQGALPGLSNFVKPVAKAAGSAIGDAGKALASPGAKAFASTAGAFTGKVVTDAEKGTKNLAVGFGNLFKAFMPMALGMSRGLVDLTKRFANWSNGLDKNKGFQGFLAYTRKEGPKVTAFFGDLFKLAGKLIIALAPLGAVAFTVISGIVGFLSKLSPGQLLAIAGGITALFIAFKVGLLAVRIATLETAAAGEVLNLVLDANPIGLVVLALGALAAGFIYAYKHSETFRTIVDGVFTFLKTAVVTVISFVRKHWQLIVSIIGGPLVAASILVIKHWGSIRGAFSSAVGWVSDRFASAWGAIKSYIVSPIRNAVNKVQDFLGKGGPLRTAFSSVVDAIGTIWDGLKAKAEKPIKFIVDTVLNHGLFAALRLLPGINKKNLPNASIKFADGGVMPGYTPGRDVHTFTSRTGGQLELSGGEAIMRPEWTRAVGGPKAVEAMNARARNGILHYAKGGIFRPLRGGSPGRIHDQSTGFPAVDIAVPVGQQVASVAGGRVVKSYDIHGYEPRRRGPQDGYRSYGRVIQILHNGFSTLYAHLSKRGVSAGTHVAGGQVIGLSGNTGNTTGPHLHFGARGRSPLSFFGGSTSFSNIGSAAALGAGSINSYGGPSLGSVLSYIKPSAWKKDLQNMGGFGTLLSGMIGGISSTVKDYATHKVQAAIKAAGGVISGAAGAVGNFIHGGSPRAIARGMLGNYGWGAGQFSPLDKLWTRESNWNPRADNPTSSAYGIPQALPGSKMASAGSDWRTNPRTQERWGMGYIKSRYGTPANAWAHSQATGWYKNGGVIPSFDSGGYIPPGVTTVFNGTKKPERVLTDQQWNDLHKASTVNQGGNGMRPIEVYDRSGSPVQTANEVARRLYFGG